MASDQLAEMARVNASKVRKDLSFLGSFGTRGSGYDAKFLLSQIDRELGIDGDWPVAVVGLGNLGRALANSQGFTSRGFRVCSLFDVEPSLVGQPDPGSCRSTTSTTSRRWRRPTRPPSGSSPPRPPPPRTWPTGWSPPASARCSTSPPRS